MAVKKSYETVATRAGTPMVCLEYPSRAYAQSGEFVVPNVLYVLDTLDVL